MFYAEEVDLVIDKLLCLWSILNGWSTAAAPVCPRMARVRERNDCDRFTFDSFLIFPLLISGPLTRTVSTLYRPQSSSPVTILGRPFPEYVCVELKYHWSNLPKMTIEWIKQ